MREQMFYLERLSNKITRQYSYSDLLWVLRNFGFFEGWTITTKDPSK